MQHHQAKDWPIKYEAHAGGLFCNEKPLSFTVYIAMVNTEEKMTAVRTFKSRAGHQFP